MIGLIDFEEKVQSVLLCGKICVGKSFYADEGLLQKVLSNFEVPSRDEIDVCY